MNAVQLVGFVLVAVGVGGFLWVASRPDANRKRSVRILLVAVAVALAAQAVVRVL